MPPLPAPSLNPEHLSAHADPSPLADIESAFLASPVFLLQVLKEASPDSVVLLQRRFSSAEFHAPTARAAACRREDVF